MIHEPAKEPTCLVRFLVERENACDLEGIVALFEPDGVMTGPDDGRFSLGNQQPAMFHGDIASTSTWFDDGGAAAEAARRRSDRYGS